MFLRKEESEAPRLVVLRPGRHLWVADWSRCPAEKHIRRVTGSTWVPTPFPVRMRAPMACRLYADLNPGYLVVAAIPAAEGGSDE